MGLLPGELLATLQRGLTWSQEDTKSWQRCQVASWGPVAEHLQGPGEDWTETEVRIQHWPALSFLSADTSAPPSPLRGISWQGRGQELSFSLGGSFEVTGAVYPGKGKTVGTGGRHGLHLQKSEKLS